MPKISIIVPVYNEELYLEECMNSICMQTLKDIEIVCIDDGSTDSSLAILDGYAKKDSRIRVIHKENTGYGNSMNVGLEAVTGEYIGIVESDDWIPEIMMQTLYEVAEMNQVDFVKADFYRFVQQSDGEIRKIYNHLTGDKKYYNRVLKPSDEVETFKFVMNIWSGIYRTDFIKSNKICFNETPGASFQDNGFWFKTFALAERVLFIDKPLYMNRRDNPLSSVNRKDKVYVACEEYDYIRKWVEELPGSRKRYEYLCAEGRIRNYLFTIDRIAEEYKPDFYTKFREDYLELLEKEEVAETLLPEVWQKRIAAIIEDPYEACKKEIQEKRRYLDIIAPYKDIIIYGAGAYGRKAWSTLNRIGEQNRIAYFAVTSMEKNPKTLLDIPVVELASLSKEFHKSALVIAAVKGDMRKEIIENIRNSGFEHYTDSMIFFE